MNISVKKRWEIVFLSKYEYGPHMSNVDISHYLRISESTVRYRLKRCETTGDIEIIQKSGCQRSATEKQDDVIQSMVIQSKGKGPFRAIKAHRAQHGQSMSGFCSLGT